MATLDTIPARAGRAEVIRALLTLADDAGTDVADIRGSRANCTLTGDIVFDSTLSLDGINPYTPGGSQGSIRLRRTGTNWNVWTAANPGYELEFAASNDGDAVRTCTEFNVGGGFWNWTVNSIGSSIPDGGDTINLVVTLEATTTDVDASFSAESGEPTAALAPDAEAVTTRDASFSAESGEPTAALTPDGVVPSDADASFGAESGLPVVAITPEGSAVVARDASLTAETGLPTARIIPVAAAPDDADASFSATSGEPVATITPDAQTVTAADASLEATSGLPEATLTPDGEVPERDAARERRAEQAPESTLDEQAGPVTLRADAAPD